MIEYRKFIYLDVYKTGSTHVVDLLKQIVPEGPVRMKRHSSMTTLRPFSWTGGKLIFSTVRNPWDWYVSLWAFGCEGKGAVYSDIAKTLSRAETAALYNAEDPRGSFRLWLESVSDREFLNRTIQQDLPDSGLAGRIGFYTYRFMRVTTPYPSLLLKPWLVPDIEAAIRYQRKWGLYDVMLRKETLNDDLIAFIRDYRERCGFAANAEETVLKKARRPKNRSRREFDSYRDYYEPDLVALVADRERFFLELFDYRF
ncbi:hypothetical protein LXM94_15135 [Rhizobium sp. TRM95111]|uniref:hypothetical protein n=1 Tax=Rhizobium alarense TaxID=2846851 RepID=UPI001F249FFA|nr:hypothetical protein [Rhizobium alarense]MCF3641307.1 hypothetical protein [Rhizobium alarense]